MNPDDQKDFQVSKNGGFDSEKNLSASEVDSNGDEFGSLSSGEMWDLISDVEASRKRLGL